MDREKKYLLAAFFMSIAAALTSGLVYFSDKNYQNPGQNKIIRQAEIKSMPPVEKNENTVIRPSVPPKVENAVIQSAEQRTGAASGQNESLKLTASEYKLIIEGKEISGPLPAGGSSVYDLMENLKKQDKLRFSGTNYSGIGFFVEEINDIENNPKENSFWLYYVNGKEANVGITGYILKPGDVIEWKFDKIN